MMRSDLYVLCFNSFKTTGRANMKLGTIEHHPRMSVITMTLQSKVIISKIAVFDGGKPF